MSCFHQACHYGSFSYSTCTLGTKRFDGNLVIDKHPNWNGLLSNISVRAVILWTADVCWSVVIMPNDAHVWMTLALSSLLLALFFLAFCHHAHVWVCLFLSLSLSPSRSHFSVWHHAHVWMTLSLMKETGIILWNSLHCIFLLTHFDICAQKDLLWPSWFETHMKGLSWCTLPQVRKRFRKVIEHSSSTQNLFTVNKGRAQRSRTERDVMSNSLTFNW